VGISIVLLAACSATGVDRPVHTAADAREGSGMQLTSAAFVHGESIPDRYTCDGADMSPPLTVGDLPSAASALALVMDDPDAPRGTWDHWVVYDIEPTADIPEGVQHLGTSGSNSWQRAGYGGPCPPGGTHRYFFTVYALDGALGLEAGAGKGELLDAMQGHVVDEATLMGTYHR